MCSNMLVFQWGVCLVASIENYCSHLDMLTTGDAPLNQRVLDQMANLGLDPEKTKQVSLKYVMFIILPFRSFMLVPLTYT